MAGGTLATKLVEMYYANYGSCLHCLQLGTVSEIQL